MLDVVNTLCYYQYMAKEEWLQVRMTSDEKIQLQRLATQRGLSMSELIRDAIKLDGVIKAMINVSDS